MLGIIALTVLSRSNESILKYSNLEKKYCHAFMLPDEKAFENPNALFNALKKTSHETNCNIIRVFFQKDQSTKGFTLCKYILTGNSKSHYVSQYEVDKGNFLSPKDTTNISSPFFVSTQNSKDTNQIGHIKNHMINININVFPLGRVYDNFKADGLYYVELGENIDFDSFRKVLFSNIEKSCHVHLKSKNFETNTPETPVPYPDLLIYKIVFGVLISLWIIFLFYYMIKSKIEISVMKMMGVYKRRIFLKLFFFPLLFPSIITAFVTLITFGLSDIQYGSFLGKRCFLALIAISICYIITFIVCDQNTEFAQTLKGKKSTKGILFIQLLVETVFLFIFINSVNGIFHEIGTISQKLDMYKNWDIASNYGVFCPINVGEDLTFEEETLMDFTVGSKLYSKLNKMGTLYIDARDYDDSHDRFIDNPNPIKIITANPNYLNKFPLYDNKGNKILVSEDEKDAVLIIPESLKGSESSIKKSFYMSLKGDLEYEKENNVISLDYIPKIRVILSQNDQYIFSFNSNISLETNGIKDPIISVITEKNSFSCSRIGNYGNGYSDPRKIPLTKSAKDTYKTLHPILKKYKLDDNFTRLVSIANLNTEELASLKLSFKIAVTQALISIIIVLIILYQSTVIIFDINGKEYCIKNMLGLSKMKIYGKFISLKICLTLIITSVYSFVSIRQTSLLYCVSAGTCMIIIQTLMIIFFMNIHQQKNQVEILKG